MFKTGDNRCLSFGEATPQTDSYEMILENCDVTDDNQIFILNRNQGIQKQRNVKIGEGELFSDYPNQKILERHRG